MTNFESITKSVGALAHFLDAVQEDALEAKGCSLDLTLPEVGCVGWQEWLEEECYDPDGIMFIRGQII